MASYQYKRLPHDGSSIRLLRLLPSRSSESQVDCEIFHYDTKNADQTSYEALSYTWGDIPQAVDIRVNGCVFAVTVNLEGALRALRNADKPRLLWVDAICIDQSNTKEQGEQVGIMWDIYKTADRVVIWLGPDEGDSTIAMESFARHEAQTEIAARNVRSRRWEDRRDIDRCGCPAGDFTSHPPRIGVQNLLGRRWCTRIWANSSPNSNK